MALKEWKKSKVEYTNGPPDIFFENIRINKGIVIRGKGKNTILTYFPRMGQGHTTKRNLNSRLIALKLAKNYMRSFRGF
jgi:hypothetical protein